MDTCNGHFNHSDFIRFRSNVEIIGCKNKENVKIINHLLIFKMQK